MPAITDYVLGPAEVVAVDEEEVVAVDEDKGELSARRDHGRLLSHGAASEPRAPDTLAANKDRVHRELSPRRDHGRQLQRGAASDLRAFDTLAAKEDPPRDPAAPSLRPPRRQRGRGPPRALP